MRQFFLKFVLIVSLLFAAQACIPSQPTPDLNTIQTAVAQTLSAVTQTAGPGVPVTGNETSTPTSAVIIVPTSTLPPATAVPTMTAISLLSPTPILTPGVTQLYVSVATNCRLGPSVSYARVGGLQVGQVANVVGRNATGDYWIIRNPERASETCWLWGQYATVVGDIGSLPVFSPPPLPTPVPAFDASLDSLESCADSGTWWLDLAVENTGGISFRSFFIIMTDVVTGTEVTFYRNNFVDQDGCLDEENQGDLDPGDTLIVSSPAFNYDPTDHRISTRLTVCSDINQSGTCLTESFSFTP